MERRAEERKDKLEEELEGTAGKGLKSESRESGRTQERPSRSGGAAVGVGAAVRGPNFREPPDRKRCTKT